MADTITLLNRDPHYATLSVSDHFEVSSITIRMMTKEAWYVDYWEKGRAWRLIHSWWPGESPWVVAVTAVLTQNIRWENAWQAWLNLKKTGIDSPAAIVEASPSMIESAIRCSGSFRRKTITLKELASIVIHHLEGDILNLRKFTLQEARDRLLKIHGIGFETADSILLYACHLPVFVVDAYTHRIFTRHGILNGKEDYKVIQKLLGKSLPQDPDLLHELHALVVMIGKTFCLRKEPQCLRCPWQSLLPRDKAGG